MRNTDRPVAAKSRIVGGYLQQVGKKFGTQGARTTEDLALKRRLGGE